MFKLFSLTILLIFATAANSATKTIKLATPTGVSTSGKYSLIGISWNYVPDATAYRIVVSQDQNHAGLNDPTIDSSAVTKCKDATCDTVKVITDTKEFYNGDRVITPDGSAITYKPSDGKIYYIPSDKSVMGMQAGNNYISIRALGKNFSKSDWKTEKMVNNLAFTSLPKSTPSVVTPDANDSDPNNPKSSFYEYMTKFASKVQENRVDEALSYIPMMVGKFVQHPYLKEQTIGAMAKSGMYLDVTGFSEELSKKIKLILSTADVKKMGLDILVDIMIDSLSERLGKYSKSNVVQGFSWLAMKQLYALGDATYGSNGNLVLFQVKLLSAQSGLLVSVIKKDIEAFNGAVTAENALTRSKINGKFLLGETELSKKYYSAYFREEDPKKKGEIVKQIIGDQRKFLNSYLTGQKDSVVGSTVLVSYILSINTNQKIARELYKTWVKEIPGRLVKQEFETRAALSALMAKADYEEEIGDHANAKIDYDEVERRAELFLGVNVAVSTGKFVIVEDLIPLTY